MEKAINIEKSSQLIKNRASKIGLIPEILKFAKHYIKVKLSRYLKTKVVYLNWTCEPI